MGQSSRPPPHSPQTSRIAPKPHRYFAIWRRCVRGERVPVAQARMGQKDTNRPALASQWSSNLTPWRCPPGWLAPTSTSALAASFRPEIEVLGRRTRVLVEQTAAVDPQRLGGGRGSPDLRGDEKRRRGVATGPWIGQVEGLLSDRRALGGPGAVAHRAVNGVEDIGFPPD